MRKRWWLALLALGAVAAGSLLVSHPAAAVAIDDPAGPLIHIHVSRVRPLDCQVMYQGINYAFPGSEADGEFWGVGTLANENACGTFLRVGGTTYGPQVGGFSWPFQCSPGAPNPPCNCALVLCNPAPTGFTPVSQSPVPTGAGTAASPWTVVTHVQAGPSIDLVQTDAYVSGQTEYRTTMAVTNNGPGVVQLRLYRAGDCYLTSGMGDPDSGYGYHDVPTNAVACVTTPGVAGGRVIGLVPVTAGAHGEEAGWATIWQRPGMGIEYPDLCICNILDDNGAGISWSFALGPGESATYAMQNVFSPDGLPSLPEPPPYPVPPPPPPPYTGPAAPYPEPEPVKHVAKASAPVARPSSPPPPCGDWRRDFDGSASSDADGVVVEWHWDFDDGTAADGRVVRHVYPGPGTYFFRLLVRDDQGETGGGLYKFTLFACQPLQLAGAKASVTVGTAVQACATASGGSDAVRTFTLQERAAAGTLSVAPVGARLDAFGCMSWTPAASDIGAHCLLATVHQGQDSASACLDVTVAAPQTPSPTATSAPRPAPVKEAPRRDPVSPAPPTPSTAAAASATAATTSISPWWLLCLIVVPAVALAVMLRRRHAE